MREYVILEKKKKVNFAVVYVVRDVRGKRTGEPSDKGRMRPSGWVRGGMRGTFSTLARETTGTMPAEVGSRRVKTATHATPKSLRS